MADFEGGMGQMFGQTPGKSLYFDTSVHTEAVNRLMYVVENGEPFVLLQGADGSGRTTVLEQVQDECRRYGHSVVLLSAAGTDRSVLLWNLCNALSVPPQTGQSTGQLMASIRDEVIGRSVCRHRTAVLIDDISRCADDLTGTIDFLTSLSHRAEGWLSVVGAGCEMDDSPLAKRSVLRVTLSSLETPEARRFVARYLKSLYV
ncbi:MAG: ATP-binding protein, partial [Planctomycetaceae bacterium]|nr:ATP-binding protein [Planctomycetaceae bacterium]